ncbi:MAG: ribosomal L7Ae/L30e/S12e/Gadd45 family protein [Clostridia bacterium]|nr:ribosomal L7Ae/L30e/S12e/Gadd45 family protein [Clostridia bacterium]
MSSDQTVVSNDAFFSMLGLAMRAGMLTLGEDGVRKAIASGKTAFVIVDDGASANTKKMYSDSCAYYSVQMVTAQAGRLGHAIGKGGRMSAAVARGPMAQKLLSLAQA